MLITSSHKVDMHNFKIEIIRTPMLEWYVVGCGSKNGYKKVIYAEKRLDYVFKMW